VYVCRGKSCTRRGAGELAAHLEEAFQKSGADVAVLRHDCFDLCKKACNVMVALGGQENRIYTHVHPKQADKLAQQVVEDLADSAQLVAGD